jgi:hypothetical protein
MVTPCPIVSIHYFKIISEMREQRVSMKRPEFLNLAYLNWRNQAWVLKKYVSRASIRLGAVRVVTPITSELPTIHQLTGRMGKPDAPLIGTYLDE